ncbi:MAG: class I SAM-dependent methyltransferase [Pseudomonadota bacterium]
MNKDKAAYFDSQADSEWAFREYTADEIERIDRMLSLAGWTPAMRILEPGCGTGRLTQLLADRSADTGFILAADISEKMVTAAVERLGKRDNVRVECRAVENLPLGAEEFHLVLCHQVFPHFDDREQALRILSAALKPAGKLVVFHLMGSSFINDMHRKTDPSVMADSLPEPETMRLLLGAVGLTVDLLEDNERGYLLTAVKTNSTAP